MSLDRFHPVRMILNEPGNLYLRPIQGGDTGLWRGYITLHIANGRRRSGASYAIGNTL